MPEQGSGQHDSDSHRREIEAIAADWLIARDRGWTPDEQCQFERWLGADPRHTQVWSAAERAWSRLDRLDELPVPAPKIRRTISLRGPLAWLGCTAAAAAVLAVGLYWGGVPDDLPPAGIVRLMPEQRVLPDGTRVDLNAGSEIAEHYTAGERRVRLVSGEAYFTVKNNPARPFVVDAAGVAVRALGTAFNVKLGDAGVWVLVTEGRVGVIPRGADSPSTTPAAGLGERDAESGAILAPGEQVLVPLQRVTAPPRVITMSQAEVAQTLDWQGLHLRFQDTPLDAVAAEFNRHSPRFGTPRLVVADSAANVLVAGTFRADNVMVFVQFLERGFGVAVEHRGDDTITLRQAR